MSNNENDIQNNPNQDSSIPKRKPPKDNRPKGTILTENFSLKTDKKQ